jgi:hypothetical protein
MESFPTVRDHIGRSFDIFLPRKPGSQAIQMDELEGAGTLTWTD